MQESVQRAEAMVAERQAAAAEEQRKAEGTLEATRKELRTEAAALRQQQSALEAERSLLSAQQASLQVRALRTSQHLSRERARCQISDPLFDQQTRLQQEVRLVDATFRHRCRRSRGICDAFLLAGHNATAEDSRAWWHILLIHAVTQR